MRKVALVLAFGLALAQPTHTVAPGDTLFSLARRYGTTVEELMRLNGLASFLLQPGQVLRLPEKGRVHVVAPGDTLYSIARRYGTTVEELMRLNGLASAELKVGQRLLLPGGATALPQAQAESGPSPPPGGDTPPEDYDPESPLLRIVLRYLGVPYKYGANSPLALDCSAFVAQVYAELGVALPRTSREQYQLLSPVEEPRPGDLVFFSFGGKEVDHVGVYLGRKVFAHASSYGSRVVIESLEAPFYQKAYRGARRVMASPAPPPGPSAGR
ncbi:C40 family peptidase [Thermus islandicus]|uniref:C40 family peptidase n=1 Tax=Thermus islandicus TaxID=540988 RepID=UPI0003B516DA|nr:C40 family peptidase [Thermus islandicus]